jgi:hypothetical protein
LQKILFHLYTKSRFLRFLIKIFFLIYYIIGFSKFWKNFPTGNYTPFYPLKPLFLARKNTGTPAGEATPGKGEGWFPGENQTQAAKQFSI